jgi:hypothetical protein
LGIGNLSEYGCFSCEVVKFCRVLGFSDQLSLTFSTGWNQAAGFCDLLPVFF